MGSSSALLAQCGLETRNGLVPPICHTAWVLLGILSEHAAPKVIAIKPTTSRIGASKTMKSSPQANGHRARKNNMTSVSSALSP